MPRNHKDKSFGVINFDAPDFQKKRCTDEELQDVVDYLRQANPTCRFNEDARKELALLVYNLKLGTPFKYGVGQSHTIKATLKNKMVGAELMKWDRGYHCRGSAVKYSQASPTPLFAAVINRYCQLKHGKGHIGYWEDSTTLSQLMDFNVFMAKQSLTYAAGTIEPVHRFNFVKTKSGVSVIRQRLIHDIHNKAREMRPTIRINDIEIARFDVKATHPQLILNKELKEPMRFDPYDIAVNHEYGKDLRNAAKLALMMMLNTSNRKSAGAAFRKELADPDNKASRVAVSHLTGSQIEILDMVHDRNPLLRKFFYMGLHRELMHLDANIVWNCMWKLAEQGIPCLSVHDELIVQKQHLDTALSTYKICWIEETEIQGLDIEPIIEIK